MTIAAAGLVGVCALIASPLDPVQAVGAGGYDQSQFESTGPELTALGMAQSFSGDGAYTVFESDEKLTDDAVGKTRKVYRRSSADGTIELVSQRASPEQPVGSSFDASISADGRWVAYQTTDAGVFDDEALPDPGTSQIALVDMTTGDVARVSASQGDVPEEVDPVPATPAPEFIPAPPDSPANTSPMVSADGSTVVFTSNQPGMSNLGPATTSTPTVESWNRTTHDITNVVMAHDSDSADMETADGASDGPVVSADGRFVAYTSVAGNLDVPATRTSSGSAAERASHVYRWDASTGSTVLVSAPAAADGVPGTSSGQSSYGASISADGDRVAFLSAATNLVGDEDIAKTDTTMTDAYLRLVDAGITHRLSLTLVDQSHPDITDSAGRHDHSTVRSRTWFGSAISTTSVAVSADGRSAVLTSMSPLLAIHGDCTGCQNFTDNNGALDVYQAQLTDDGRVRMIRPISIKRTNQNLPDRDVLGILRTSTTGGGDSIADGSTPATADGAFVAFSSQAGDLRGVASTRQISKAGPPNFLGTRFIPVYVDGGEPDDIAQPVRTFTIAANSFNSHLYVPPRLVDSSVLAPGQPIGYESRPDGLVPLESAPVRASLAGSLSAPTIATGGRADYVATVTAASTGSAELVFDLDGVSAAPVAAVPTGWAQAKSDQPRTITFVNPDMHAGDTASFTLALTQNAADPSRPDAGVSVTINNDVGSTVETRVRHAPERPACTLGGRAVAIAGVPLRLPATQCTATTVVSATAAHGTVAVDSSGTMTYTPTTGHLGDDTITVVATDWWKRISEPVTIPVGVTRPFGALADGYSVARGGTLAVDATTGILANDVIPGGTELAQWRIQRGTAPRHGTVTMDDATGAFSYVPEPGYTGDDEFSYRVNGTGGYSAAHSDIVSVKIRVGEIHE